MAFESLSTRLTAAFKHIVGKDRLSEKNMQNMLNEIRTALLEADVNYRVVKQFIEDVSIKMEGAKVDAALNPSEMVYKIVKDEITQLLGSNTSAINYKTSGITVIMAVGLQGTGKTTNIAKIAKLIKEKDNRKPLLVAADLIRPAAIEQLETLGKQIDVTVYSDRNKKSAYDVVNDAIKFANNNGYDTVLIDTAGRLHIDKELMKELTTLKAKFRPDEILLTVDALTGQDIVNVAKTFNELLNITGLIVTKFDGDARGGGVLSVVSITNVAVKFVGVGEKIDDIDVFYPDRMASRILGMGDLETLVEKAQALFDEKSAEAMMQHLMDGSYSLDDMLIQMKQLKKMGPFASIMKMMPNMGELTSQISDDQANYQMVLTESIINSMTPYERRHPETLRNSHKIRIANGCGRSVNEVNKLLNSFEKTRKAMGAMGLGRFRKF